MDDPCYARIYLTGGLLRVVTLQDFDEHEYDQRHFLRHDEEPDTNTEPGDPYAGLLGRRLRFPTEDAARAHLSLHYKPEFIHPDDRVLTPLATAHMRLDAQ